LYFADIEEFGVKVTLRERSPGGPIQLDCASGPDGSRDRHSTGCRSHEEALEYARAYIRRLAKLRMGDAPPPPPVQLTIGQLFDRFRRDRLLNLRADNRSGYDLTMRVVETIWGRSKLVMTTDQDALDELARRRTLGDLIIPTNGADGSGFRRLGQVGQNTVCSDYRHLHAILEWARKKSTGPDQYLLDRNPLARLDRPAKEKNPRQPISDARRFAIMLRYADVVDPTGRLRLILMIARYTGRRRGEICALRCSDLLLDTELVRSALAQRAAEAFPTDFADVWVHGGIRWPEANNKQGLHWVVPIGPVLARAIRAYLQSTSNPTVGDAPLFPAEQDLSKSVHPDLVGRWFRDAETRALVDGHPVPHLRGGCWHPLRRLYRTEKKKARFDAKDVFFVAGWAFHDGNAGNAGYLHYDAADLLQVALHEIAPEGGETRDRHSRSHRME
jgi:integrase